MYSEQFKESLALVEASRDKNIALDPVRMTAEQKENVLASFHPDYKADQFSVLQIGPNKGDKVPTELAEILQAHSRISGACSARASCSDCAHSLLLSSVCRVSSAGPPVSSAIS